MSEKMKLGGEFTFPATNLTINRVGYGAMRLSGPGIMGAPKDREEAVRVLRTAIEAGVNHIDTSDFYGPHVTNEIIREALHPYRQGLVLVTKVGARRGTGEPEKYGSWNVALSRQDLIDAVHDNLRNLGVERLDVVNLRVGPPLSAPDASIEEPFSVLAELQQKGLIAHLGLSTVSEKQIAEGQRIAPVVCVQNHYNVVNRDDDAMIDSLARQGIAYVPYFPLGGFSPLQDSILEDAAKAVGATVMQVALAWLLHRSQNVLLIPGTSSVAHLKENLAVAAMALPPDVIRKLDGLKSVTPIDHARH